LLYFVEILCYSYRRKTNVGRNNLRENKSIRLYIVLSAVVILLFTGCGGAPASAENQTEPVSESASAAVSQTPTPIPTPTPTEPPKGTLVNGWIAGIPAYVPLFSSGSIDRDQSKITEGSISSVFDLYITGVRKQDMDAYSEKLEEAGYKVAAGEIGSTYTLIATKDMGYGKVTLVITLNEAEQTAQYTLEAPV
jgi:hypothetical protein